ncbi:MAG: hypothetical protein WC856_25205 [Methylococcaceae bacterium]|jgi:hypothetical protein
MTKKLHMPQEPEGGNPEPRVPKPNLFALPKILNIEVTRVRFREPRPYYVGQERIESSTGVELLIRTDGPIPIRALSPALYIGKAAIDAYEEIGTNVYRFIAYRVDELKEGAPISFGWLNSAQTFKTEFHYSPVNVEEDR